MMGQYWGAPADDYALANVGQLKNLAAGAANALDDGGWGAGANLRALVDGWLANQVGADDYAVVTQGQLKTVADVVYGRLVELGYEGPPMVAGGNRPWTATTADDDSFALVNLGQLKAVFAFYLGRLAGDWDEDSVPDSVETMVGADPATPRSAESNAMLGLEVLSPIE